MKRKIFIIMVISVVLLTPPLFTKAEVPSGVFGFMDGKYYDNTSTLRYLCFMDNNCYDLQGNLAFKRAPTVVEEPSPTTPNYDQPFRAELTKVVGSTSSQVELQITVKLQDGTKLSNQTVSVHNKTPGAGFYYPYQTDSNGTFTINALYEANEILTLRIQYNNRYFNLNISSCEFFRSSGTCA